MDWSATYELRWQLLQSKDLYKVIICQPLHALWSLLGSCVSLSQGKAVESWTLVILNPTFYGLSLSLSLCGQLECSLGVSRVWLRVFQVDCMSRDATWAGQVKYWANLLQQVRFELDVGKLDLEQPKYKNPNPKPQIHVPWEIFSYKAVCSYGAHFRLTWMVVRRVDRNAIFGTRGNTKITTIIAS